MSEGEAEMTWEIAFVLGLTVCAVVLFVTEKFSKLGSVRFFISIFPPFAL